MNRKTEARVWLDLNHEAFLRDLLGLQKTDRHTAFLPELRLQHLGQQVKNLHHAGGR